MCSPGRDKPRHCVEMLYVEEGSKREQCHSFSSPPSFSHFCHYPQSNWALLVLIPRWVGLCTFWDPVGLSNELSCEAGSFSRHLNPHRIFSVRGFEALFPHAGTLGCTVCLTPQLFLLVYPCKCGNPIQPATASSTQSSSRCLAMCPFHPGSWSLPLVPV